MRPLVIAHRGASQAAPENTVPAFRLARDLGADMVELDVRRTADGTLAVHHDPVLPDGRPLVELTRDQLPAAVPDLAEAVEACQGMGVNIEIKNWPEDPDFDPGESLAVAVADFIGRRGLHERVVVSSFHLPTIDRVRSLDPAISTAWLVVGFADLAAGLATLVGHGHGILHPHHRSVTEELLARCRDAGVLVNTWTLDDPDRMRELARWGIDGICTNVPDVARAALGSD